MAKYGILTMYIFVVPVALIIKPFNVNTNPSSLSSNIVSCNNHIKQLAFDGYSCLINGERVIIRSASFHYFRLPNPRLWRERLLRLKQAGYNTVDLYLCWSFHSPSAGQYDFSGVRDLAHLFQMVEELDLWMIVRPGPYINAEVSGGGLPEWLLSNPEVVPRCRKNGNHTNSPLFLEMVEEWWRSVFPFFVNAPNLLWVQIENEYATQNMEPDYMQALVAMAKRLGATCPLSHNDLYGYGSFSDVVDLYALDHYPFTDLEEDWKSNAAQLLAQTDCLEAQVKSIVPQCPLHIAESQAGWFTTWKQMPYAQVLRNLGAEAFRIISKSLLAQGVTIFNHYHACGGTNWGYLGSTDTITSYDFAAMVGETGDLRPHFLEALQLNNFLEAFPALATTTPIALAEAGFTLSNSELCLMVRKNKHNQGQWLFLRNLSQVPKPVLLEPKHSTTLATAEPLEVVVPPWDVLVLPWQQPLKIDKWLLQSTSSTVLYQSSDTLWILGDKPTQVTLVNPQGKTVQLALPEAIPAKNIKIQQVTESFLIAWVGSAGVLPFRPETETYYQQSFTPLKPASLVPLETPIHWVRSTIPLSPSTLRDSALLCHNSTPNGALGPQWWSYAFLPVLPQPKSFKLQAGHLWKLYVNNTLVASSTNWQPNPKGALSPAEEVELAPLLTSAWRSGQANYLWLYTDSFGRSKGFHDDLAQIAGVQSLLINGESALKNLYWLGSTLPMEHTCDSECWVNASITIPRSVGDESPLAFQLTLPKTPLAHRVDIYLEGVLMGRYWADCQAQTVFYLPLLPSFVKEGHPVLLSLKCVEFTKQIDPLAIAELLPQLKLHVNYPSVS